jgi:hypothetical protein
VWTDVFDMLSAGQMPPTKKERPEKRSTAEVLAWLKAGLTKADVEKPHADGRVVLRRLNREECENTICDLLDAHVEVELQSVEQERERAAEDHEVNPDQEDLHPGVSARAAIFARHVWVNAEELLVVFEQVTAREQCDDKQAGEDDADEEKRFVLHMPEP